MSPHSSTVSYSLQDKVSSTQERLKACRTLLHLLVLGVFKGNLEDGTFQGSETEHLESCGITVGNKTVSHSLAIQGKEKREVIGSKNNGIKLQENGN